MRNGSQQVSGGGESRKGHCCDKRESHVYPTGKGRDNWERRGWGVDRDVAVGGDGVCWEGAVAMGGGGT